MEFPTIWGLLEDLLSEAPCLLRRTHLQGVVQVLETRHSSVFFPTSCYQLTVLCLGLFRLMSVTCMLVQNCHIAPDGFTILLYLLKSVEIAYEAGCVTTNTFPGLYPFNSHYAVHIGDVCSDSFKYRGNNCRQGPCRKIRVQATFCTL